MAILLYLFGCLLAWFLSALYNDKIGSKKNDIIPFFGILLSWLLVLLLGVYMLVNSVFIKPPSLKRKTK